MCGPGSGNRSRRRGKKATVEDSLVVSMKDLRRRLYHGAAGTFARTWTSLNRSSVGYAVARSDDAVTVTLLYRGLGGGEVRLPVRLEATPARFGARR